MTKLLVSMLFAALMFTAGCSGGASTTPRATNTPRPATSVPTQAPTPEPTAAPADSAALAEGITALDQVVSDFTLVNQKGEETRLSDLQGKLIVLSFGYTHCPDVCPITLAQFGRVRNLLGEDAEQVQFVFISVDGTRDTPERLAQYLPVFNADCHIVSGQRNREHRAQRHGQKRNPSSLVAKPSIRLDAQWSRVQARPCRHALQTK